MNILFEAVTLPMVWPHPWQISLGTPSARLDTNVRDDAALDAHFVASIREHGVLQINSHQLNPHRYQFGPAKK